MSRSTSLPPARLMFGITFLPEDFPARLERFKEASNLTWDGLAGCLGVDPRQLQRWRKGTKPNGDGLCALILLAARIPGGFHTLLGTDVIPPAKTQQAAPEDGFRQLPGPSVRPLDLIRRREAARQAIQVQSKHRRCGHVQLTEMDRQSIQRPFPKDFPERLEWLKELSGLSWRGVAREVGVTPSRVTGWRRGRVPEGFALLNLIRFSLGVEGGIDALFPDVAEALRRHEGEE